MNLTDIGVTVGLVCSIGTPSAVALKYYADHEYVLVADSLKGQLFNKQLEVKKLELKKNKSAEEKALLEFLRLQEQQIQEQIN